MKYYPFGKISAWEGPVNFVYHFECYRNTAVRALPKVDRKNMFYAGPFHSL